MEAQQIYQKVKEHYSLAANSGASSEYGRKVATAFGYTEDELVTIPQDANLGLSCGNPLALAKLKEGETVIDLGSGAGFDIFNASKRVGDKGKAIGVDMNKEMLEKANRNKDSAKWDNVSFVESAITNVALPDGIADCIISNCVVNLVPEQEKQLVFNEMFRLLRSGGRVAMSDILTKKTLPEGLKNNVALYVGCIAGASQLKDYEKYLRTAGFTDTLIVDNKHDLNVYTDAREDGTKNSCCGKSSSPSCGKKDESAANGLGASPSDSEDVDFNEWAGSFQVYAMKQSA